MRTLPLVIALSGCGWNLPHSTNASLDAPLWDPAHVVSAADGLYVPMPHAGGLAFLPADGEAARVELGEGRVVGLSRPPGGPAALAAVVERYRCDVEDERDARKVDSLAECPAEALQTLHEIDLLAGGSVSAAIPVQAPFHELVWDSTGSHAIAWMDPATAASLPGVVNLTSVTVIDASAGTANAVPVGFIATDVLFDDARARAIVLSQSAVAVLDLATNPPTRDVTFQLTLDPDQVVTPVGIQLTPDGDYALISVAGQADLYVLDLVSHSVNIVSLDVSPTAMHVDADDDLTVLVSSSSAAVEVMDHALFDVTRVPLDEPMDAILDGDGFDLLYARNSRDVYRLDPATGDIVEFRLQAPLLSLSLSPTEEFAIAFTSVASTGGRPGMEVLDLRDDRGHSYPYLLEGVGIDARFTIDENDLLHALILQDGVDYVYALDLYGGTSEEIALDEPPLAIGSTGDGAFYVTHPDPLGLISRLNPADGAVTSVANFALLGLNDDIDFVVPPGEETP